MAPLVSVVIATYNWSSVLRYAIETALGQTIQDIEVLVIGDGCTDDSAEVVASFRDTRLIWHNLPSNTGSQSAPNNAGIAMARGRYVAYLSHDDLWMPHHLERLVAAIERDQADLAYGIGIMVGPEGTRFRALTGVSPSGSYEAGMSIVPSCVLHRTHLEIGPWPNPRELNTFPSLVFIENAWAAGKRFAPVREVTMFKFPAPWRKDVYRERPFELQAGYVRRMKSEPDFLSRELLAVALAYAEGFARSPVQFADPPTGAPPGWVTDQRARQSGAPEPSGPRGVLPLYKDATALRQWNSKQDIVPAESLAELYRGNDLPAGGLFLGRGWYGREADERGCFHWVNTDAEIVITRPSSDADHLILEVESGPGMRVEPFELKLYDEAGALVGTATVSYRHDVRFDLPPVSGDGALFRLIAPSGGRDLPSDPRILNFRVFSIRLGATRRKHSKSTVEAIVPH
jgi:hypothetical protein